MATKSAPTYTTLTGTAAGEFIFATNGNESIAALGGNDIVFGVGGNDTIDGGAGSDIVQYTHSYANYSITQDAITKAFTITDLRSGAPDGTDVVFNVESFYFADGSYSAATLVNGAPNALTLTGGTLAENSKAGTLVGTLKGSDPNTGDTLTYSLTDSAGGRFVVNAKTGAITVASGAVLDFETTPQLSITARVTDALGLTYDKVFTVTLTNVNEAPTALTLTGGTIAENSAGGTVVGTVQGTDPDAGAVLTYSLTNTASGKFVINANTGVISVAQGAVLDFETTPQINIAAKVTDQSGLSFSKNFVVSLTNVNEAPTALALTGGTIKENSAEGTVVGTVKGTDPDKGDVLTYSLTDNANGRFVINATTGVITVAQGAVLDFETTPQIALTARVTDQGGLSFDKAFTVNLTNVVGKTFTGTADNNTLVGTGEEDSLSGLAGNDTIIANAGNDTIIGGAGNDSIDGGGGNDRVVYSGRRLDYHITQDPISGNCTITDLRPVPPEGIDTVSNTELFQFSDGTLNAIGLLGPFQGLTITNTLSNVEINGSDGNDVISISNSFGLNTITGFAGNDTISGGDGFTTSYAYLDATRGSVTISALNVSTFSVNAGVGDSDTIIDTSPFAAVVSFIGSSGNDLFDLSRSGPYTHSTLTGGGGNDTMIGNGNEWIIASYFNSTFGNGITVALNGSTPSFVTVQAGTDVDQLVNIEAIFGTYFSDSIVGDNCDNWLASWGGNDTIYGYGGNDYLDCVDGLYDGGSGNDTITGGGPNNAILTGGIGDDLFQFYNIRNAVITDFNASGMGQDTLQITFDSQITDWTSLLAHTQQSGADILIIEGTKTLTLKDITLAAFQNSNVKFGN